MGTFIAQAGSCAGIMGRIAVILGTRPEVIRLSDIIRMLDARGEDYFVVHTGQHYDHAMDGVFFDELEVPRPKYNLNVGSASHAKTTARILERCEEIFVAEKPSLVMVYGDTNSTLAAALAAVKLLIPVAHLEAGARIYDQRQPEEVNRVFADHVSTLLFPADETAAQNLLREGLPAERIFRFGNPLLPAAAHAIELSKKKSTVLDRLGVKPGEYSVVTMHRQENVDDRSQLSALLDAIRSTGENIVFPIHPRTRKRIEEFGLTDKLAGMHTSEPLGYFDFLRLLSGARLVFTDSGGVQVEANLVGVPCVVLLERTAWSEFVDGGLSVLADAKTIPDAAKRALAAPRRPMARSDDSPRLILEKCLETARQ